MKCDFSIQHYGEILLAALQSGYHFLNFEQLSESAEDDYVCLLRHDIDYAPEWALDFSEVERSLGIKASYFFQVAAYTYNIREAFNYRVVQLLQQAGHQLGLHVDISWNKKLKWSELAQQCESEKALFEALTDVAACDIVSFHNTHCYTERILNQNITGVCHCYERQFFSDIKYLSDSQGWYEGCPCQLFQKRKYRKIQLLVHPYLWSDKTTNNFSEDIARFIAARSHELLEYLVKYHPVASENKPLIQAKLESHQQQENLPDFKRFYIPKAFDF